MKEFSVKKYTSQDYAKWNEFVTQAHNATFLFHRDFMEYHQDRFEDYSLFIENEKGIIAVLPANKQDSVLISHQGLTYGGLVSNSPLRLEKAVAVFHAVLQFLNEQNIQKLHLKSFPSIYSTSPSQEWEYVVFVLKAQLVRRDALSVVRLKETLRLSKDRKEGVKRGIKNELVCLEVNDCSSFWNEILIPNLSVKHQAKPVHSLEEITYLKQKFPQQIRQFNVYYKDKLVAGTTIFETENVAHSQYISGNALKNELGSLDFLHHHLLTEVFMHKKYFDFGISNENQGKNINKGLSYWKESFGCHTVIHDFYDIDTAQYSLLENVLL